VGTSGHAIYQCTVNNNLKMLTDESTQISGVSGTHERTKSNNDVIGFDIRFKTIHFFPKGLDKFFKNLKMICIHTSQLKEIHQSDLEMFKDLMYFYIYQNEIEIIEEGLFDFNPTLVVVGIWESKIIHIDPNVFDHLNKLSNFRFGYVPCVGQDIWETNVKVQEAIQVIKSNCSNSEFLSLGSQIKNLEIESKTLNSEDFNTKLESFEKNFKNSKFSKFRPLNYKFQSLKSASNNITLSIDLKNITHNFEDQKASQCGLKHTVDELKASQNSFQTALIDLKSSNANQESKLNQIQKFQKQLQDNISQIEVKVNDLKSSQTNSMNDLGSKISEINNSQKIHGAVLSNLQEKAIDELSMSQNYTIVAIKDLKLSQDSFKVSHDTTLSNLTSKFNNLKKDIKSTQDDTKLSISDIVATLSDHTKFQIEAKDSFVKIRTVQNEIKKSLNDLSINRNEDSDISDKVNSLEGHFLAEIGEKLDKNEKQLTNKLHKMSTNFDEKIKGIEKRLMKKFEEILDEKLNKFLTKN